MCAGPTPWKCSPSTKSAPSIPTNQKITTYEPFYSLRHSAQKDDRSCFWLARRRASSRPNDDGTEVSLSLLDLSTANVDPDASVLSVRTTCTNRDLPSRLPFGNQDSDFEMEGAAAMKRIVALRKPTAPVRPELGKSTLWRLISHLSLNYLSLVEQGKDALQEILRPLRRWPHGILAKRDSEHSRNPQPPALHAPGFGAGSQLCARTAHRDGARRRPVHRRWCVSLCQCAGAILRPQRLAEQLYPAERHHSAKKGGTARMATEIGPETSRLDRRSRRWATSSRGRLFV